MHTVEFHVNGKWVESVPVEAHESEIDVFEAHVRESAPGETLYLYKEATDDMPRTLVVSKESPYN
jgi:hypothetical protein